MSLPVPNLPHWPITPEASGAAMEQFRNEMEQWCRAVADNLGLRPGENGQPFIALRVLRVTGSPATGWFTTRLQQFKKNARFDPASTFAPASVWEDVNGADDSYLIDPSGGTLATGSYVASWFQIYSLNNKPAFLLMAGAGGALPSGQYQYMVFGNVAQNQTGFFFPRSHPVI